MDEHTPKQILAEFEGAIIPQAGLLTTDGVSSLEVVGGGALGAPFVATVVSFEIILVDGISVVQGNLRSAHDDR
jgi:hypothetical protein